MLSPQNQVPFPLPAISAPEDPLRLAGRIQTSLQRIAAHLDAIDPEIRNTFPEGAASAAFQALPITAGYGVIPEAIRNHAGRVRSGHGTAAAALFLKLLLGAHLKTALQVLAAGRKEPSSVSPGGFPGAVCQAYFRHFNWILHHLLDDPRCAHGSLDFADDLFLKDLSLCTLRMFPLGAHVIELHGLSSRFVFANGWRAVLDSAQFYLRKMRGNTPFYHVHLHERGLADFHRAGWHALFLTLAELLKRNPKVRGVFGSSWFYDPALETVSPGLLYLRKVPEIGGAKFFKMGCNAEDIEHATRKSGRRRLLYEQGKYLPTSYLFIWSRADLCNWADERRRTHPAASLPSRDSLSNNLTANIP